MLLGAGGSLEGGFRSLKPRKVVLETLPQKHSVQKGLRVAQTVECMPSKLEALSSNPSTAKNPQFIHFKYINVYLSIEKIKVKQIK
jgi:hypothetical protein